MAIGAGLLKHLTVYRNVPDEIPDLVTGACHLEHLKNVCVDAYRNLSHTRTIGQQLFQHTARSLHNETTLCS